MLRARCLFLTLVCLGCGDRNDDAAAGASGWSGQVRDSAGITVVANPTRGIWTERTRWTIDADLVLGANRPDAPEYEFGSIADVDAGANGRIYVLDDQAARVSVFEPDGRYAFAFGRLGKGPGELSIEAVALRIDADDAVAVRDGINRRDVVFDADGAFVRAVPLDGSFEQSAALPADGHIERVTTPTWDGLLHVAQDESILDTVATFGYDRTKRGGALSAAARAGGGNATVIPLLPTLPSWGVRSDGHVLAGVSDRYRIEVRRPTGELVMLIDRDHAPLALDADTRARMLARVRTLLRDAGLSDAAIARTLERFAYAPPDSLPAFADIVGGPAATIWVQAVPPVDSMTANATLDALNPGSAAWSVFCHDGRYLGDIALPPGFTLMRVRSSFVYGIETDELDVQRVVRLEIRPGAAVGSTPGVTC